MPSESGDVSKLTIGQLFNRMTLGQLSMVIGGLVATHVAIGGAVAWWISDRSVQRLEKVEQENRAAITKGQRECDERVKGAAGECAQKLLETTVHLTTERSDHNATKRRLSIAGDQIAQRDAHIKQLQDEVRSNIGRVEWLEKRCKHLEASVKTTGIEIETGPGIMLALERRLPDLRKTSEQYLDALKRAPDQKAAEAQFREDQNAIRRSAENLSIALEARGAEPSMVAAFKRQIREALPLR